MTRHFLVSATLPYGAPGPVLRIDTTSPHQAVKNYVRSAFLEYNPRPLALRIERSFTDQLGRLFAAWSCEAQARDQGLSVYVKEQIGGFDTALEA